MISNNDVMDVLVVGAGLAGLLTAYRLKQAGMMVKILETHPHLGGPMTGVEVREDKAWVDRGEQWLGPTQYNILELLEELDIQKFDYAFSAGVMGLELKRANMQTLPATCTLPCSKQQSQGFPNHPGNFKKRLKTPNRPGRRWKKS
jgi:monoamine oxidase